MLKIKNRVAEFKGIVQTVPHTYVTKCPLSRIREFAKVEKFQSKFTTCQQLRQLVGAETVIHLKASTASLNFFLAVLPCKTRDVCAIVVIDYEYRLKKRIYAKKKGLIFNVFKIERSTPCRGLQMVESTVFKPFQPKTFLILEN